MVSQRNRKSINCMDSLSHCCCNSAEEFAYLALYQMFNRSLTHDTCAWYSESQFISSLRTESHLGNLGIWTRRSTDPRSLQISNDSNFRPIKCKLQQWLRASKVQMLMSHREDILIFTSWRLLPSLTSREGFLWFLLIISRVLFSCNMSLMQLLQWVHVSLFILLNFFSG